MTNGPSYMGKYVRISSFIRKPFIIYDFATAPFLISLYVRNIFFSFLSLQQKKVGYLDSEESGKPRNKG
jgi:hypothetical protein